MKRYPVVLGATVAGLAGVLSFHTSNASSPLSNTLQVKANGGHSASSTSTKSTSTKTSTPPASSGGTSGGSSPATAPSANSSASGVSEQYGYGVLSVKVTIVNSKIADVKLSKLQTADTYSQVLAQQVVPYLRRQVLAAQSAHISGISGATYTSEAYALSVQSALDHLHFK